MAVNNNHCKLAQYCAANFEKERDDSFSYVPFSKISNSIFDSLEDINCKLPEINSQMKDFTLLHLAIQYEKYSDVENLLKRGADFTIKNGNGHTPLHQALHRNYSEVNLCILRLKLTADPNICKILSAHVDYNILENPSDENGISHFHVACMVNHLEAVKMFLRSGVSVDKVIQLDSKVLPGYTPLHLAARYCALETVILLLGYGADVSVSQKDAKGMTPLNLLMERKMIMVEHLNSDLAKSYPAIYRRLTADIEINEKIMITMLRRRNSAHDLSSLQYACSMQNPRRAELLLNKSDLQFSVSKDSVVWPGYTALHFAAHCNIDTVKLLVERGGNMLATDAENVTPFDLCVEMYSINDIHHLITSQPNLSSIVFSDRRTKLSSFVFAMRTEDKFKSFIQKLSDISISIPLDSPLWPGYTLLHLAIVFLEKEENYKDFVDDYDYYMVSEVRKTDKVESEKKADEKVKAKLNLDNIKFCLQRKMDVTAQDSRGRTPLHLAFRRRSKILVDLLLESHKKIVNPVDDKDLSHIHIAIARGNTIVAKKLLKARKDQIDKPVKFELRWCFGDEGEEYTRKINAGSTALHIAVARCDHRMIEFLIKFGADVYARDDLNFTPIHLMLCCFDIDIDAKCKRNLELIQNLEDRQVESNGLNYLHVASYLNSYKIAQCLLDQGVNIESKIASKDSPLLALREFDGMTPLQVAYENSCFEVVELLMKSGAEVTLGEPINEIFGTEDLFIEGVKEDEELCEILGMEKNVTILHLACATLDIELAQNAINQEFDVNDPTPENSEFWPGCTSLHIAMKIIPPNLERLEPFVKLLLSHGAEVTLTDIQQDTPIHVLHSMMRRRKTDLSPVLECLLKAQKDFNVNPADRLGISHFHVACSIDCAEIVKEFLNHGVDVNSQVDYLDFENDGGSSPLHLAINYGSVKSRDLLLKHGVDLSLADRLGNTPLHCAIKQCPTSFKLFQKIISAGANVMAVNIYGVTPFEMLLESEGTPKRIIEMILKGGVRANSFNPITEEGYLAIAFHANFTDERDAQIKPAFEVMMSRHVELATVDEIGRNAIHNLVSYQGKEAGDVVCPFSAGIKCNCRDNYVSAIDQLVRIGCDVDRRDKRGHTPLHIATQLRNHEAIVALLNCGANLNIVDENDKPALAYVFIQQGEKVHELTFSPYYSYMSLISSFGFRLSEKNIKLYFKALSVMQWLPVAAGRDGEELKKLKSWEIGSSSVRLYDFLLNEGVKSYASMRYDDRLAVDEIFQSDRLRKEVPINAGFLILRYNQARLHWQTRLALLEPAKNSLDRLGDCRVPHVCAYMIFELLEIEDLQNVIASVSDFV